MEEHERESSFPPSALPDLTGTTDLSVTPAGTPSLTQMIQCPVCHNENAFIVGEIVTTQVFDAKPGLHSRQSEDSFSMVPSVASLVAQGVDGK
jgi:hypothetical protein